MKKILIYSILLFALCSCDNFLEEDPRGKLTPSSFFSSPEDLGCTTNITRLMLASSEPFMCGVQMM